MSNRAEVQGPLTMAVYVQGVPAGKGKSSKEAHPKAACKWPANPAAVSDDDGEPAQKALYASAAQPAVGRCPAAVKTAVAHKGAFEGGLTARWLRMGAASSLSPCSS